MSLDLARSFRNRGSFDTGGSGASARVLSPGVALGIIVLSSLLGWLLIGLMAAAIASALRL
jgi:hypothetical protein